MRATRITYVGELGWELYVPTEFAVGVYQDLVAAGAAFGLRNAGYYAIESMRLEKGYRAFGRELTPDYNPVEAGLLFACKLGTDVSFLGREAVEKAKAEGPRRKLVSLVLDEPERPRLPRWARCGAGSWCCATAWRWARSCRAHGARPWAPTVGLAYVRNPRAASAVTPAYLRDRAPTRSTSAATSARHRPPPPALRPGGHPRPRHPALGTSDYSAWRSTGFVDHFGRMAVFAGLVQW